MREITFAEATIEATREEMQRDDKVFVLGEDIARQGGVLGQFKGLSEEFGSERIIDTPISETAIVGAGLGAALAGMRPVIDMHYIDFITVAMDEVVNQIAKIRYMTGGQCKVPVVIRAPDGITSSGAAQHSQSLEAWFLHVPGLQVVCPSTAVDAKGLLKAAIRSDNPVLYLEHKLLFKTSGEVPAGDFIVPIGKAKVVNEGKDITVISYSLTMNKVKEAAVILEAAGVSVETIDLRTISPLDWSTIFTSVAKTGRVLIVHEAVRQGGVGAEIAAEIAEKLYGDLKAPVKRLGAPFVPVPFSPPLERLVKIEAIDIVQAVQSFFSEKD